MGIRDGHTKGYIVFAALSSTPCDQGEYLADDSPVATPGSQSPHPALSVAAARRWRLGKCDPAAVTFCYNYLATTALPLPLPRPVQCSAVQVHMPAVTWTLVRIWLTVMFHTVSHHRYYLHHEIHFLLWRENAPKSNVTVLKCFFLGNGAITSSFCVDPPIVPLHLNVSTFCMISLYLRWVYNSNNGRRTRVSVW